VKIVFVSSVAPITPSPDASRALYVDALGLPLVEHDTSGYASSESIPGSRHFGVWPLEQAAEACFGAAEWPADRPIPQASIEFEVESAEAVAEAADELQAAGHELLHGTRTEPWGQTVARLQSPEGLIVGVSFAPWMH
jgi:catechol 2,3-dioxygenase-like lactoylglutathione lyase family enzyme